MAINGNNTSQCTHLDAQNLVKSSQNTLTLSIESYADPRSPNDQRSPDAVAPPKGAVPVPKPTTFKITATIPSKPWQPSSTKSPTSGADDSLPPPPPPTVTVPVSKPTSENGPELYCEGCKQQIRGPYLTAQGKNWHPDEFVCASPNCGRPLQNVGFIEEKGQRYCSDCYEKYFAHSCAKCHKKIVGEVMHALNQTWHVTCFVCTSCNQPFRDGVFHLEHDKPYCVADYNKQFGTLCKGCGFAIEAGDHFVEAIKSQWHESCFTCAVCHIDLKNAGFYSVNNKPVCSNHKNARLPA
uniref:LIM zinc-binding domain-containing protein n=1 Tax=Ciona savignyi TaxID=51511 RepID=H2YS35_CIOSA